jgi:hypothetical protein
MLDRSVYLSDFILMLTTSTTFPGTVEVKFLELLSEVYSPIAYNLALSALGVHLSDKTTVSDAKSLTFVRFICSQIVKHKLNINSPEMCTAFYQLIDNKIASYPLLVIDETNIVVKMIRLFESCFSGDLRGTQFWASLNLIMTLNKSRPHLKLLATIKEWQFEKCNVNHQSVQTCCRKCRGNSLDQRKSILASYVKTVAQLPTYAEDIEAITKIIASNVNMAAAIRSDFLSCVRTSSGSIQVDKVCSFCNKNFNHRFGETIVYCTHCQRGIRG